MPAETLTPQQVIGLLCPVHAPHIVVKFIGLSALLRLLCLQQTQGAVTVQAGCPAHNRPHGAPKDMAQLAWIIRLLTAGLCDADLLLLCVCDRLPKHASASAEDAAESKQQQQQQQAGNGRCSMACKLKHAVMELMHTRKDSTSGGAGGKAGASQTVNLVVVKAV
jgi:hypothetical protein